jgi:ABC-type transport system, involved in lipoprotein release, permease component
MTWLRLSLKEWQRRPLRTSITAAGVAIATATLFSLLAFQRGYREGVRQELSRLGAHILVVPKGCPYDAASIALHGGSWPCYLKGRYLDEVRAVAGVATAAPVFMSALYASNDEQFVYVGVETNILALKPGWRIDGRFPENENELLVGSEAARRNRWKIGQQVKLPGLGDQNGLVAGMLAPAHGADDTFIYLRLPDAQRLFERTNELTHILVRLADPNALDETVKQLRGCDAGLAMNVVPLAHLFHTIQSLVNSTRVLLGCVALVALLVAGVGVSNTVLMAVTERTRELGVMRAIGASQRDIFELVWLETIQVCLTGAVAGVALAFLASRGVEAWVRRTLPFSPTDALVRWEWWIAAACLACVVVLGSLAGFLPAWRAARVSPMTAIQNAGGHV